MICLDTDIVIAVINNRPAEARDWFIRELSSATNFSVPVIALYEMIYGYGKSDRRARSEAALRAFVSLRVEILPFEQPDAEHAGHIRAHLEALGTPIGHYDILIAAQARCRGSALVTLNRGEFERVPGLVVADWTA